MPVLYSWALPKPTGLGGGGGGGGGSSGDSVTPPSTANAVLVRSAATGSGVGTLAGGWANAITALPATPVRDTTYWVADGSYSGQVFSSATSGTTPIVIRKATVADHATDTGWSDTYDAGQATFSGQMQFTTAYWWVDGRKGGGAPNAWGGTYGFKFTETGTTNAIIHNKPTTANNNTFRHIELVGMGTTGSGGGSAGNDGVDHSEGPANLTFSYCYFHDIGRCHFFGQPNTIIVEQCWLDTFYADAVTHGESMSWTPNGLGSVDDFGGAKVRYNLFTGIASTGMLMWDNAAYGGVNKHGFKCEVYGNVFYHRSGARWDNTANGLVGGWDGGGGEDTYNLKIYNNTFISVDGNRTFTDSQSRFGLNEALNNLFIDVSAAIGYTTIATHDYNHYNNSGGSHSEANEVVGTSMNVVNAAAFDFRPTAAGTAGTNLGSSYNVDGLGNTRTNWTRGAFEYV